ncbi:MAG: T9SS type A sorting domain-containing protein [Ignavibacteriales bacterium]|nr:T9SS type A sorting domain-containing protein [Ignavibacteriales bacterium]
MNYTVSNDASGFIKLKVYDVLGKEIKTLISEIKKPGSYSVNFNAGGLSAGIYFYTLITDNSIQTKKMTLVN